MWFLVGATSWKRVPPPKFLAAAVTGCKKGLEKALDRGVGG